jgi:hypothetical protein
MARDVLQQPAVGAGRFVGVEHQLEPLQIKPRIFDALIKQQAAHAFAGGRLRQRRKHPGHVVLERLARRSGMVFLGGALCRRRLGARGREPGAEATQVGLDRLAVGLDRRFQLLGRKRQPSAAGDGAKHHRIDHGAAFAGKLGHVEEQRLARV